MVGGGSRARSNKGDLPFGDTDSSLEYSLSVSLIGMDYFCFIPSVQHATLDE